MVSQFLTLNILRTFFLMFLLLTVNRQMFAGLYIESFFSTDKLMFNLEVRSMLEVSQKFSY